MQQEPKEVIEKKIQKPRYKFVDYDLSRTW